MRLPPSPRTRRCWAVALAVAASVGLLTPATASAATQSYAAQADSPASARSAVGGSAAGTAGGAGPAAEWTWRRLVYSLNPEFVTAAPADRTPVATMEYAATEAVDARGDSASVWTARVSGKWQVVNIATGSDETDYAALAGAGEVVFREPQLNAWYRVAGGRVVPLNEEARDSVGAAGAALARYQRLVHKRYADKMPGSGYDKRGAAGGYDTGAGLPRATAETGADAGPDAAPAAAGAGALAAAGLAGGLLLRRRRRNGEG